MYMYVYREHEMYLQKYGFTHLRADPPLIHNTDSSIRANRKQSTFIFQSQDRSVCLISTLFRVIMCFSHKNTSISLMFRSKCSLWRYEGHIKGIKYSLFLSQPTHTYRLFSLCIPCWEASCHIAYVRYYGQHQHI